MDLPNGEKLLMLCLLVLTQFTNVTDTHKQHRHRMTAYAALIHRIARQKRCSTNILLYLGDDTR